MESFASVLIDWYARHKRELPWRNTRDPYLIWISEIILQQTRVAQGLAYYLRFTRRFPTPAALAAAPEDEVLKLWQGLGYYSRARNLHAASKSMNGVFPSSYKDVLALKGVGEYTAAAVCSFAYRMPYAVVDGNVYRVLARVFGIHTPADSAAGKKEFAALAQKLLDKRRPDLYNQAIMDFGALQCVPSSPDCAACPLQKNCRAFQTGETDVLPVRAQKPRPTERFFNYICVKQGSRVWLRKRPAGDVWQGLYEPPLAETPRAVLSSAALAKTAAYKKLLPPKTRLRLAAGPLKHVLSHRVIYACLFRADVPPSRAVPDGFISVPERDVPNYPVSRLVHSLLEKSGLL